MKSGEVPRYSANERVTHWIVAILFILLAVSGLAFFHPAFWFLSSLLGGGPWARILHPFLGVAMFVFFFIMAARYWQDNVIQSYDQSGTSACPTSSTTATTTCRRSTSTTSARSSCSGRWLSR